MSYSSSPPMALGETLKGTDDDGNLINSDWLGRIFDLPLPGTPPNGRPSGRPIKAVLLRNVAGFALLGQRLGSLYDNAGYDLVESVDGYAIALSEPRCVVIDPHLGSAGVADDDIFWGIINGPAEILSAFAGAGFNGDIAVGAALVAGTVNTTNGNSTAGRIANVTLPGTTGATAAFNAMRGLIGTALSARTTGETNSALLVNVQMANRF